LEDFKDFITEKKEDDPYRLVVLSHDDSYDPNMTGVLLRDKAKKLKLDAALFEFVGMHMHEEDDKFFINSFHVEKDGTVAKPDPKKDIEYDEPFEIDPKNTLIMIRGLGVSGVTGNVSWAAVVHDLEDRGFTIVNSMKCHDICSDKVRNQIIFERENFNTPRTIRISHAEGTDRALESLDVDFPIILKTGSGSRGVGVILVESASSCASIVQLLYRENPFIDILLQEKIETKYDVRVIVCGDEIIGAMKRPVVKGDFRSNVSQGSEPVPHKLTELEKTESLRAASAVDGSLVGVDFIPAKDREKEKPYFIEVNSTPGLIGIDDALSVEGSVVEKILIKFKDRQYWKGSY